MSNRLRKGTSPAVQSRAAKRAPKPAGDPPASGAAPRPGNFKWAISALALVLLLAIVVASFSIWIIVKKR